MNYEFDHDWSMEESKEKANKRLKRNSFSTLSSDPIFVHFFRLIQRQNVLLKI